MTTINCEYCSEFQGGKSNTFNELYGSVISHRILLESQSFKVIPTIGQLFDNSLLIVPVRHVETLSDLTNNELNELMALYRKVKVALSAKGFVVAFEHGAHAETGGGCGIYHAHLHVVPLPKEVNLLGFFKHKYRTSTELDVVLRTLKGSREYLVAVNQNDQVGFLDLTDLSGAYASQYFRRALNEEFHLDAPWDWKAYGYIEKSLLTSVLNNVLK